MAPSCTLLTNRDEKGSHDEKLKGTQIEARRPGRISALQKLVDASLAAAGAGLSVQLLSVLQTPTLKLWGPPQAASAAVCFLAEKPPPLRPLCLGTLGGTAGAVLISKLYGVGAKTRSLAIAFAIFFFKISGNAFPPAAAFCSLFFDNPAMTTQGWKYPIFPCLSGNLIIYISAMIFAHVRASTRKLFEMRQQDILASK